MASCNDARAVAVYFENPLADPPDQPPVRVGPGGVAALKGFLCSTLARNAAVLENEVSRATGSVQVRGTGTLRRCMRQTRQSRPRPHATSEIPGKLLLRDQCAVVSERAEKAAVLAVDKSPGGVALGTETVVIEDLSTDMKRPSSERV